MIIEVKPYVPVPYHSKVTIADIAAFAYGQALEDGPCWHTDTDWFRAYALKEIRHRYDIPAKQAMTFTMFDVFYMERPEMYVIDSKFMVYSFDVEEADETNIA
jgi:hypothetical protein